MNLSSSVTLLVSGVTGYLWDAETADDVGRGPDSHFMEEVLQ